MPWDGRIEREGKDASRGADTLLVKEMHKDAIDLSGGERQKLALARALYKDAPIVVLDEPTAALDPIAENGMYKQCAALTHGKTGIYISHRLASTRFCDRILLIEEGRVAEGGTLESLVALGGKYAEMFRTQASYYQESALGTGNGVKLDA
jgi:ATP-binding cassette subfamily B protein